MDGIDVSKRKLMLDDLSHTDDETGIEFWYAREVMEVFGYTKWQNFEIAIGRAKVSLESNKTADGNHFADVSKMVKSGVAEKPVKDYKLTRYACYLIAQNGDPRKPEIAFAQSYFALQTRKQELIESRMAEVKRMAERELLTDSEKHLAAVAFERGVDSKGFATIKSKGDKALFGGHDTRDMKKRLGVSEKKPLADVLPDVTIAAKNLANTMTAYNTEKDDLQGHRAIESEHISNNSSVRVTLTSRGIHPEDLPPEEDTKKLKRRLDKDEKSLAKESKGFPE